MNYLTNYYKNLYEQLQQQVDILEANLNSLDKIRRNDGSQITGSMRAFKREEMISSMIHILKNPADHRHINAGAVERVLRDAVGVEDPTGGSKGASPEDLKHVLAHLRVDYYDEGSKDPQEQKLAAARQRTLDRYG
jgi:hypothetical protein